MDDIIYQSQILCNRILKRYKHLKKWAKRSGVSSFRLYNKDIPEIPLIIDFYEGIRTGNDSRFIEKFLVFYLYERPYKKDENEEYNWLKEISKNVATLLEISSSNIFLKIRKKQKGILQYQKISNTSIEIIISEQGQKFLINLSDYLDTGLFFDHRPLRQKIHCDCNGKNVLNLYCYTASFSIYAAAGSAKSVTSVDLSNTYLNWAKKNFLLNGFSIENKKYDFINTDVFYFLNTNKNKYDIIILDPPTFSNSKKTQEDLDINRDWHKLVTLCSKNLTDNGVIYFSTNSRKLNFDPNLLPTGFTYKDITSFSIPEDFKNKKIHKCFQIYKN
ncbi:MAG: class I SAM-dependent methyltransferase [Treponemataceae bacterium]